MHTMSFRQQIWTIRAMFWIVALAFALLAISQASGALGWALAIACCCLAKWSYAVVVRKLFQDALVRVQRHTEARQFREAHALIAELRAQLVRSQPWHDVLRLQEGVILIREGRYAEAARVHGAIDGARLHVGLVSTMLNNYAWCLALAGDGPRAVAMARQSIAAGSASPNAPERFRTCQLGTLGAALVVAGKPSEAIEPLEKALAAGGSPSETAARAFFLGEALQLLGRDDEAKDAWKHGVDAAADDEFGKRSQARLERSAAPYRG
jgi:tetratricopeptide (TPR) repeat protein